MYFDFEINEAGDIAIEKASSLNSSNIRFSINKITPLKVKFGIRSYKSNTNGMFSISFKMDNNKELYKFRVIKDEEVLKQKILLKLKTLKGDIVHNTNFGSLIEKYKYNVINQETMAALKNYILTEVRDEIPNAKVAVSIANASGIANAFNIKIYTGDRLMIEYNEII